jgi:hypothetical protein
MKMGMARITKPAANERQSASFPAEAGERSVELGFNTGEVMDKPGCRESVAPGLSMEALAHNHPVVEFQPGDQTRHGAYDTASISAGGKLVYRLERSGVEALAAANGPIFDYVSYVDVNGVRHTVQVVLTAGTKFISGSGSCADQNKPDFTPGRETRCGHKSDATVDYYYKVEPTDGDDVLIFYGYQTRGLPTI